MTDITVKNLGGIVTAQTPDFLDPEKHPPPLGVQMFVFTRGGVIIKSTWSHKAGFLAWYPLPRTPQWLKEKLTLSYKGSKDETGSGSSSL